jgi:hypothetical protein
MLTVFLLSGTDRKMHLFMESKDNEFHGELNCGEFFPELEGLPSSVTAMSFKNHCKTRYSAVGCQNGFLKCSFVDMESASILKEWKQTGLSGPMSVVQLFCLDSTCAPSDQSAGPDQHRDNPPSLPPFHVLACSAVELANVYLDVGNSGFSKCIPLHQGNLFDSILCAEVADVNWDGRNEIVLGTFGKRILVYKAKGDDEEFELQHIYQVAFPVHGVKYCDIIGDGLRELAVLSTRGVHIFQHNLQEGIKLCVSRLKDKETKNKELQDN